MSSNNKSIIYLDHAATTPIDERVRDAMVPHIFEAYANPSALYSSGVVAASAITTARQQVAAVLGAQPDTITFTGSATEANNLALFGIARAHRMHGTHIITTAVEHEAIIEPCKQLEAEGFDVTYLPVDESGQISLEDLKAAIRPDTILISIMYANNEVGTVYPIADIGKYLLQYRKKQHTAYPLFHTDACQAVNYLDVSVERLHVDLLTLNASKLYGPKGVGALYIRRDVEVSPIIFGGGQEQGLRSGTENVPAIVGLGKAIEISQNMKEAEVARLCALQAYFWEQLKKTFGDEVVLNGPDISSPHRDENVLQRLPNNLNVSFLGYEGETLVLYLDAKGICVSTGSACASGSDSYSHVLAAMHVGAQREQSAVRFTLGRSTTTTDIDVVVQAIYTVSLLLSV